MPRDYKRLLITIAIILIPAIGSAISVEELQRKSAGLTDQIKQLDKEIATLNVQLRSTKTQKSTLTAELAKIDTARKKLLAELTKTEKQISVAGNNILKLSAEISVKAKDIGQNQASISEALRNLRILENESLIELIFSGSQLSELIGHTESLAKFQGSLEDNINALRSGKATLETKKSQTEAERKALAGLKSQLADQKQVVEHTKKEKDALLAETKSQESTYQQMLAARYQKKEELDKEIGSIEAQIKVAIDPSLLPKSGGSALSYPVGSAPITQYFGNTAFAAAHTAVYNGKGHNGLDFGVPLGTAVLASAEGKVMGAGDTDKTCPGASYGKWVLLEHPNGLSTLYAHLSYIKVAEGESVIRGQTIGYSGNTGYSTGPHLHFTVYASQGVQVSSLQSKVRGCGIYRMPIASYNSYLNPLNYLGK